MLPSTDAQIRALLQYYGMSAPGADAELLAGPNLPYAMGQMMHGERAGAQAMSWGRQGPTPNMELPETVVRPPVQQMPQGVMHPGTMWGRNTAQPVAAQGARIEPRAALLDGMLSHPWTGLDDAWAKWASQQGRPQGQNTGGPGGMVNGGGPTGSLSRMAPHQYPMEARRRMIEEAARAHAQQQQHMESLAQTAQQEWQDAEGAAGQAQAQQPAQMDPMAQFATRLGGGISQALDPRMGGQQVAEGFIGQQNQSLQHRQQQMTQRLVDKANRLAMRAERMGDQASAQKYAAKAWELEQKMHLQETADTQNFQAQERRASEAAMAERQKAADEARLKRDELRERRKGFEAALDMRLATAKQRMDTTLAAVKDYNRTHGGDGKQPIKKAELGPLEQARDAAIADYDAVASDIWTRRKRVADAYGDDPKHTEAMYGAAPPTKVRAGLAKLENIEAIRSKPYETEEMLRADLQRVKVPDAQIEEYVQAWRMREGAS